MTNVLSDRKPEIVDETGNTYVAETAQQTTLKFQPQIWGLRPWKARQTVDDK